MKLLGIILCCLAGALAANIGGVYALIPVALAQIGMILLSE